VGYAGGSREAATRDVGEVYQHSAPDRIRCEPGRQGRSAERRRGPGTGRRHDRGSAGLPGIIRATPFDTAAPRPYHQPPAASADPR